MSFASDTKKEITQLSVSNEEARAELSAIIRMNGTLSISNGISVVNIQTENAAIARRIYSLLKQVYNLPIELLVRKKMQLKKNNVYIVRLKVNATKVLADLNITEGGFIFSDELPLFLNTNQRSFCFQNSGRCIYLKKHRVSFRFHLNASDLKARFLLF